MSKILLEFLKPTKRGVTNLKKIKNAGKMEQKAVSQSLTQIRQEFPGNIEFEMKMAKIENPASTSMSLSGN